jgi:hypothetical protein
MLQDNIFGDLVPPQGGGLAPPPLERAPPTVTPDKPGEQEARDLRNEKLRQEIEQGEAAGVAKVEERRAAGFLGRMIRSHELFGEGIDPRSPAAQQLYDITPENFANAYSSTPEQRAAKTAVEDFIRAKLRLESGAAIGKDELAREYPLYFPMPGDKPEDLERKKGYRMQAIIGMKSQAGAAAQDLAITGGPILGGGELLPATAASMGMIPSLSGTMNYEGIGDAPKEGEMPTKVDTGPKPVLDAEGRPLMEVTIENPMEATRDAKRAEAYRQKQDRTFGRDSAAETMLLHGMSGTLSDEAAGIGTGLSHLLTGQNPFTGYVTGRDAERMRIEDARNQLGGWGTAAEFGGALLSANPEAAVAPVTNVLATLTQGAKASAAGGALFGYGSGEGFGGSLESAVMGGGIGAAAGAALPALGMVASRALQPRGVAPDLAAAARAENVRLRSPMLDDNARRIKMGKLEGSSGSAPVIQRAVQETTDDIERAAARAGGPGNVAIENDVPGGMVQNAGRRFIQRTKGVADRLYNRARSLAGDAAVTPREGLAQLRRELMDLQQAPNVSAEEIKFINDIGADLTNGPLTTEAIRAIRQGIRSRIDQARLTSSPAEARAHRILDAVQQDVTASLPRAAATAFRRADTYYRERMTHIDDILERFIGNNKAGEARLSGEAAFKQLRQMASPNGDGRRLAAMWRDMTPDEQADVAATLMHTLGRRANQPDAPFSIDLFISQAATLSPSAKRTIFGPSGADSVNNLVRLSRALQASQKEVNKTKSGSTVARTLGGAVAAALLGGGGGAMAGGSGTAALAALGAAGAVGAKAGINNLSARALMSPRVSNWLADVAQATTPRQIEALSRRLGVIAGREPALASELTQLQQALTGQVRAPALAEGREDQQ